MFAVAAFAMLASGSVHAVPPIGDTATASQTAIVDQPRPFGYVIGDVFTQRILLQINGTQFEPATMPASERIGVWLERHAPAIETMPDGRDWLAVDYQIINAPQQLTTVTIPAWKLPAKSATDTLRIAEWSISVSPLTQIQAFTADGPGGLRPDRLAPHIAIKPLQHQIAIWSGASFLIVLMWLGWFMWRNWQSSREQPFARALREMRRFNDKSPPAWRALHRAFDSVAGQVMQTTTLAILFQKAPQLNPLQTKIEIFFEQSSAFFFGEGLPANPVSVHELCAELRRIEKRHER
jgi:mxaA protein